MLWKYTLIHHQPNPPPCTVTITEEHRTSPSQSPSQKSTAQVVPLNTPCTRITLRDFCAHVFHSRVRRVIHPQTPSRRLTEIQDRSFRCGTRVHLEQMQHNIARIFVCSCARETTGSHVKSRETTRPNNSII